MISMSETCDNAETLELKVVTAVRMTTFSKKMVTAKVTVDWGKYTIHFVTTIKKIRPRL